MTVTIERWADCLDCEGTGYKCLTCNLTGRVETLEWREGREQHEDDEADRRRHEPWDR